MNKISSQRIWNGGAIAIVTARFNSAVTELLFEGACEACARYGIPESAITAAWVPGAYELPLAAKKLAQTGHFDALICLGAVIRGETTHYDLVCQGASSGIAQVSLETEVPVILGLLTTENQNQALARAGIKMENCGFTSVEAAIEMINFTNNIPSTPLGNRSFQSAN